MRFIQSILLHSSNAKRLYEAHIVLPLTFFRSISWIKHCKRRWVQGAEWKTETVGLRHRYIYTMKFNYNNGFYYFEFYVISIVLFYMHFIPFLNFRWLHFCSHRHHNSSRPSDWARRQTLMYTHVPFFAHFVNMQLKQKPTEQQWKMLYTSRLFWFGSCLRVS